LDIPVCICAIATLNHLISILDKMATETLEHQMVGESGSDWSGGKQPFKASYGKLMMWYFLLSDSFTFAGFLIAYGALRFSMPSWPVPDFVFQTFPFFGSGHPLLFVTLMTFVLLFSSYTMIRAVQEGHRENKNGVVLWMFLTILGGAAFLGCQAWEWTTLIGEEHMSVTTNPFGTHTAGGVYLDAEGNESSETFEAGESYLMHMIGHGHGDDHGAADDSHSTGHEMEAGHEYADAVVDERGYIHRKFKVTEGQEAGMVKSEAFGPKAFGALFFFITGFHGFHVLSGVVFLLIILLNVASGLYIRRRNGYEMVEKIGLYWHFVDLVWVFVFLVFYLI
jgi:cytochrome c oxidase subunit 3